MVSDIVNNSEFGVTDDLYALGFTSLTLMKLNSIIFNEMDANIDISVLFNEPTIRSISEEIRNDGGSKLDIKALIETAKEMEYY